MQNNTRTNQSSAAVRTANLYLACGLLLVLIFAFDLAIPLGVAAGVPYIVAVLLSLWSPQRSFTYVVAVLASILTLIGFFYSPPGGELWKVLFNRGLALFAIWVTASLGLQRKISEEKREKAVREREKALEELKILRGYLPICAACKKIRNDAGYWTQIEAYIRDHSEANFTHSICPECSKKLYPEFFHEEEPPSDP
jgi:hypothetical protein